MRGWVEPAARLPLRWGRFGDRLAWGGMLLVGGTVALAGADSYQLLILLVGTIACFTGWGILPTDGWRRLVAAVPATLAGWLLLGGPRFIVVLMLVHLGWMLVRHRPLITWLTAVIPLATGIGIAQAVTDYRGMLVALVLQFASMVLAGWLSLVIARRIPRRSAGSPA